MKDKRQCPLLKAQITDAMCLETCLAVEGMTKMSSVPEIKINREEAQKICFECENYKE